MPSSIRSTVRAAGRGCGSPTAALSSFSRSWSRTGIFGSHDCQLIVFLTLFWRLYSATKEHSPARYWMVLATCILGLVTFPWNQGASTFFVYAAAFLPFLIDSAVRVITLILLECLLILGESAVCTIGVPQGPFHIGWPNAFIAIFLTIVVGGGNIYFAEQKRAQSKLHAALEENVSLAAVAERERIARDLHDVLAIRCPSSCSRLNLRAGL